MHFRKDFDITASNVTVSEAVKKLKEFRKDTLITDIGFNYSFVNCAPEEPPELNMEEDIGGWVYLYTVSKKDIEERRRFSREELEASMSEHRNAWFLNDVPHTEFFCFGYALDERALEYLRKEGEDFFFNPETQDFCHDDPLIINEKCVLFLIQRLKNDIISWYRELLQSQKKYDKRHPEGKRSLFSQKQRIKDHLKRHLQAWTENDLPLSLNNNNISHSDLYEHAVFELIHKYKTTDWTKNVLIFTC